MNSVYFYIELVWFDSLQRCRFSRKLRDCWNEVNWEESQGAELDPPSRLRRPKKELRTNVIEALKIQMKVERGARE